MISAMMIKFRYQLPTSPVKEEKGCTLPIKSNPALQKAEILWKTENQIPFGSPNFGQKWKASKTAPINSIENVPIIMKRVIFTIPPICGADTKFCIKERDTSPILRFVIAMMEMQSVIKPILIIKFLYRRNKNHLFVLYINYIDYKRLEIKNILRKKISIKIV